MKKVKKTLFLLMILLPCVSHAAIHTKDPEIPKNILAKIDSLYPNATQIDWVKDMGHYQADFVYKNKCVSILFKKNGEELYFREEITAVEIPSAVREVLNQEYLDKGYKMVYVMTRWAKNDFAHQKLYEIEVVKGRRLYFVRYDGTGKLVTVYEMSKIDISKTPSITP